MKMTRKVLNESPDNIYNYQRQEKGSFQKN